MKLIPSIFFIIILMIGAIAFHEITHAQILDYYDVENYDFFINWNSLGWEYIDSDCDSNCELAHSINEIVGYNIVPFLIIIVFILVLGEGRNQNGKINEKQSNRI